MSPSGTTLPNGTGRGRGPLYDRRISKLKRFAGSGSFPYVVWSAITVVLLSLQHVSSRVLRDPHYSFLPWHGLRFYVDGWLQFDGPEYVKIAEHGYWYTPGVRSPVVWFPLYPMALRGMNQLVADPIVAGIVVASIGGLAAVGLYWRWLRRQGIEGTTRVVAFLVLLTYPYAWYLFGVVHSDAVFLALAIGAFLLVERRQWLLAGLVGALATATRPTGLALIPALFVLGIERGGVLTPPTPGKGAGRVRRILDQFAVPIRVQLSAFRPRMLLTLLSMAGVGGYMLFLGLRFGDPMAFRTNQTVYHPGGLPVLKLEFFVHIRDFSDSPSYTLTIIGQAIAAGVVLCSTPFVGRRFGWGYGVFIAALVAIPTFSTEDFMGTGRYLIAAFPVAALIGEWLAAKSYRWVWVGTSGAVMAALSMGFARSWYLT